MYKKYLLIATVILLLSNAAFSQLRTNRAILQKLSILHKIKEEENKQKLFAIAKEKNWPVSFVTDKGNVAKLDGIDPFGLPIYVSLTNTIAAVTTGASKLWEGGSSGLNLSGSSNAVKGKVAIWDGGNVLTSHVEFNGRVINKDDANLSEHATHVAGTIMAAGVNPLAKGMAYGLQQLLAYDFFTNRISEISSEAQNLILSNHSYGANAGWVKNETQSRWEFWGREGDNEDHKFGYYDSEAQILDSIAYNAPYYLMVFSSGNNRNSNGPAVGETYWRRNANGVMINAGPRPGGISSNDGFDIIPMYGNAKNNLTVGAVVGIKTGYFKPIDASISTFSSWGPTDDGRIKPDVVAQGVNLLSTSSTSNNSYVTFSGTSMAAPNTTGSILLLQEYYARLHNGAFMRAATLKGLAIHTAEEAGDAPGPDYRFGWGLINVAKGADVIKDQNASTHKIFENVLNNGNAYIFNVIASGRGPLKATISWTDPKGTVETTNILNNRTKKLVHDLDIKIKRGTETHLPWVLDPANPTNPATKGVNELDNVEQINIDHPIPGETYTIEITHKGTLERGSQAYSLLISGVGGTAYCTSSSNASNGTKIENVTVGTFSNDNTNGCKTYTNFTNQTALLEPNKTIPFSVKVGSCDGSTTSKIVKIFIDYNNNGSFSDAGELVATSGAIAGNATFTGSFTTPSNLIVGNSTIMRIVAQDASSANDVSACGNYNIGETQDYRVLVAAPENDIMLFDILSPENLGCNNPSEYITVKLKNNGSKESQNIPLTVIVKSGTTTLTTINNIFKHTLSADGFADYTFQTPVSFSQGSTYTIEAIVSSSSDQLRSNDTLRRQITIAQTSAPSASGVICGQSAALTVTNPKPGANYFWYTSPTSQTPIGRGTSLNTGNIPPNNTFYVASGLKATVGPVTKMEFPEGGYNTFSGNSIRITADVPVVIETARLYTGSAGTVKITVHPMASETSYYPSLGDAVTLQVSQSSPTTPVLGAQVNNPNDTGAIYRLNLKLDNSVSNNYIMFFYCENGASLFRNNNITSNPYPIGIPNVFNITRNNATDASDPNYFQKFYYFLYNTQIKTLDECPSSRTTVVAPVAPTPVITQVNDSLVSSIDEGNQWYHNGTFISGANQKKYKPTQNGSYTVVVTDSSSCQLTSAAYNFSVTAINPVANAEVNMRLAPNPNNGTFRLSFFMQKRDDLKVEIVNAQGQNVLTKSYSKFQGSYSEEFNMQNVASGLYMLRVQHGNRLYYNKILIQK